MVKMVSPNPNAIAKLSNILNNIDSILYMAEIEASNLLTNLNTEDEKNRHEKNRNEFKQNNLTTDEYYGEYNKNHTWQHNFETNKFDGNSSISHYTYFPIHSIRYYVEGVVLVPVSIIGLFGK